MEQDPNRVVSLSKVKYTINMLPSIGFHLEYGVPKNEEVDFFDLCLDAKDLDIFESSSFLQLMNFKWDSYSRNHHLLGFAAMIYYVVSLIIYVAEIYIHNLHNNTNEAKMITVYDVHLLSSFA